MIKMSSFLHEFIGICVKTAHFLLRSLPIIDKPKFYKNERNPYHKVNLVKE